MSFDININLYELQSTRMADDIVIWVECHLIQMSINKNSNQYKCQSMKIPITTNVNRWKYQSIQMSIDLNDI